MRQRPRILIVDEPRMSESLKMILSHHRYEAVACNNGVEGINLLCRNHFDLVLVDLHKAVATGHEFVEYVKRTMPKTLVTVMSAYASPDSVVEAMRWGAFDYIRKPFDFDELLKSVKNAIIGRLHAKESEDKYKRLRRSAKFYRYLIDCLPDLIYALDHAGRFTFINKAGLALLGYQREHLIGEPYTAVLFEDDLDRVKYRFNERRSGKRVQNAAELRLKQGHYENSEASQPNGYIIMEVRAKGLYGRPIGVNEKKFLGTLGIARDISSRRRVERKIRSAEMRHAFRTLSGGVAHEFNNLFQVILGFSELLLQSKGQDEAGYAELNKICEAARKAGDLTQKLLEFRPKNNAMEPGEHVTIARFPNK